MNPFVSFLIAAFVAIPIAFIIWLVSFFAIDNTLLLATGHSVLGALLIYWFLQLFRKSRFLKKHGLSRKEYRYIKENLDEAKRKIKRLNKATMSIKHIPSLKQRIDVMRVTRRIYSLTKREPKRFYKAEGFFFSHLDSAVELSEKYAFLSAQPKKTSELEHSLYETRQTLNEISRTLETDLNKIVSDDIDHLNFEIDVAKHSIKTLKDSQFHNDSRRLK